MLHEREKENSDNFKQTPSGAGLSPSPLGDSLSSKVPGGCLLLSECISLSREGFIKLHRVLADHAIKKDPSALILFIDLLLNAEWKSGRKVFFKGKQIELDRGQLTRGRHQLSESTGLPSSTVRNALKRLQSKYEIVDIQQDKQYSIITICNYDRYQNNNFQEDNQEDTDRTTKGQPEDTFEEVKKVRSKEQPKTLVQLHFESVWKEYPRKLGKAKAFSKFKKTVNNPEDLEKIQKALSNYKLYITKNKIEEQFIKHASTWFGEWGEWVSPEGVKVPYQPKPFPIND